MHSTHFEQHNVVRYGELKPCKTAFIDAHTPGSHLKENFTIIGAGVSESPDQHIHIRSTPGFNIGAAGQPPKCKNSLHSHRTAEVFFVLKGRWRFFWGRHGTAGEVILEEGDLFNIPTGMFRGFENIGTDYGMIMAILGGNNAGGGVIWSPEVLESAREHGLVLGENQRLYDTKQGEKLPADINPMPPLSEKALRAFAEPSAAMVIPHYVARYWDLMALSSQQPSLVIGEQGLLKDRPGFELHFINGQAPAQPEHSETTDTILMIIRGHWQLSLADGTTVTLNPGDCCNIPANTPHSLAPTMSGEASLYLVKPTQDPAGATHGLS